MALQALMLQEGFGFSGAATGASPFGSGTAGAANPSGSAFGSAFGSTLATSQLGPLHLGLLLQQVHLEVQIRTSHLLVPIQQELLVRVHPILLEVVLTALLVNQLQDLVLLVGHLVAIRTLEEQVVVYLGRAVMLLVVKAHRDLVLPIIVPHLVRPNQTTHLVVQTIIHHLVKAIRNNSQGLFGSGTGNAFGSNTGGSTFGSNNTGFGAGGNAFGQQGNTGFGANKPVTTGFGSSTSGGLFGQQSQQQQPGATGGLFGQNQQQQQNAGGGLFGAKPAGGSVFGQSNTNASGGGLFGGQQNTPTTGGGYLGQNLPLRVGYLVVNNQDKHNKEEGCLVNKINKIHREVDCLETSLLVQPRQMVVGCLVINRQQGRIVWWSTTTNPATTTTATISIRAAYLEPNLEQLLHWVVGYLVANNKLLMLEVACLEVVQHRQVGYLEPRQMPTQPLIPLRREDYLEVQQQYNNSHNKLNKHWLASILKILMVTTHFSNP